MRVYGYATASFYTYLLLMLACTETADIGKHFDIARQKTDETTPSYSTTCKLYSKTSGKFVQVMRRVVNANGSGDSDAATLVIETDTFGKVRIRHYQSNYYICMNMKGEIIGLSEKKGKHLRRCIFKPIYGKDGYTQFVSDKYGVKKKTPRYLAFRNTGEPKHFSKVFSDEQRATKFLSVGKNPQKRSVKRNIRRRRLLRQDELSFQERNRHKRKRLCFLYLRCLHKKWKLKRRRQTITIRCSKGRRRNYCNCKCAKQ